MISFISVPYIQLLQRYIRSCNHIVYKYLFIFHAQWIHAQWMLLVLKLINKAECSTAYKECMYKISTLIQVPLQLLVVSKITSDHFGEVASHLNLSHTQLRTFSKRLLCLCTQIITSMMLIGVSCANKNKVYS